MSRESLQSLLRKLPKIDSLLRLPGIERLCEVHGRERVADALRSRVEDLRRGMSEDGAEPESLEIWLADLPASVESTLREEIETSLIGVINATGVLVHTNLGRAPLSAAAISRLREVSGFFTTLEYDLARGTRGSRSVHAQRLVSRLFPGCAGHVVNNNAAAVLLAINTLAEGREVVVSRGELVEIGGSFRIPDVMRKGQAILKEVGTTNRTRIADYEEAITEKTALLLKVHTSNYRIVGFTMQASLPELADLGRRRGLPVVVDQGSGNLLDLASCGVQDEPSVTEILAQGADLVTFSGDKLLGGPQCGVLVGRTDLVERCCKNPLSRALRVDKLTYAALEATLEAYVSARAEAEVPVLRMLRETPESVAERARRCAQRIGEMSAGGVQMELVPGSSLVGGGAAPTVEIPTHLLAITVDGRSADEIEAMLRESRPPVIGRIQEDRLVLDLRTVLSEQEEELAKTVAALGGEDLRR